MHRRGKLTRFNTSVETGRRKENCSKTDTQQLAAKANESLRSGTSQRPERTITRGFNTWKLLRVQDRLISFQSLLSPALPQPPWQSPPQLLPTQELTRAPCSDSPRPGQPCFNTQHLHRSRTPPTVWGVPLSTNTDQPQLQQHLRPRTAAA